MQERFSQKCLNGRFKILVSISKPNAAAGLTLLNAIYK